MPQEENQKSPHYLISAMLDENGAVIKGTALPICDTFIAIDDIDVPTVKTLELDAAGHPMTVVSVKDSLQLYLTDEHGAIHNFESGKINNKANASVAPFTLAKAIKNVSQKAKLYFPPSRLLMYNLAVNGHENWVDALREQLTKLITGASTIKADIPIGEQVDGEGLVHSFNVEEHFAKPLDAGGNITEQGYRRWYNNYKKSENKLIKGFILPRVRALSVVFSSEVYVGANIRVLDHQGLPVFYSKPVLDGAKAQTVKVKEILDDDKNIIGYGAVLYDADLEYDPDAGVAEQIYRIEVELPQDKADEMGLSSNVYVLAERLRFDIHNLAGEFEMVNGDAISLEEALIKQFPVVYRHIIQQANSGDNSVGAVKKLAGNNPGILPYVHGLNTSLSRAKLASGILGAKTGQVAGKKLGKFIFDNLTSVNGVKYSGVTFSDVVNIAFNVHDTGNDIIDLLDGLSKSDSPKLVSAVKKSKDFIKLLKDSNVYNKLEHAAKISGVSAIELLDKIDNEGILKKIPAGLKNIELPSQYTDSLRRPKKSLSRLNKKLIDNKIGDKLGYASDAAAFLGAVHGLSVAVDNYADARGKLTNYSEEYASKLNLIDLDQGSFVEVKDDVKIAIENLKTSYADKAQISKQDKYFYVHVNFEFEQANFKSDESMAQFTNIVSAIPSEITLTLIGHTCDLGSPLYNKNLSQRRAESVKVALISAGINTGKATVTIVTEGRGSDEQQYKEREKNRRVEAVLELRSAKRYYPSREGMDELERYRALTTFTYGETNKQIIATVVSAIDGVMGAPKMNPAHVAAAVLWYSGKLLIDIGEFFEKLTFGEDFLALLADKDKKGTESISNQILLMKGQENNASIDGSDYLEFQLRLRAEALTGLLRLLMRCSLENGGWLESLRSDDNLISSAKKRTDFSYSANVKHYQIDKYIDTFILNDGWELPINPIFPISLDDHWIHLVETEQLEQALNAPGTDTIEKLNIKIQQLTGVKIDYQKLMELGPAYLGYEFSGELLSLLKTSILSRPLQGFDYIRYNRGDNINAYRKDALIANYQECFPIHNMAAKNVDNFADQFNTDFSGLDKDAYLHTSIHVRAMGLHSSTTAGWVPLAEWLKRSDGLSPLHQIRICVLLDTTNEQVKKCTSGDKIRMIPVQVNPVRRDCISNMTGPSVTGYISKLQPEQLNKTELDLLKLNNIDQAYGVILTPYYMYGVNKVYGTKPMAGQFSAWLNLTEDNSKINPLWNWRGTWEMTYAYDVVLAYKKSTQKTIEYKPGEEAFAMSLDTSRIHKIKNAHGITIEKTEEHLLDRHFLETQNNKEVFPELLKNDNAFCLMRHKGNANYLYSSYTWKNNVAGAESMTTGHETANVDDFRWQQKVELLVLVVCDEVNEKQYQGRGFNWKTLPGKVQLNKLSNAWHPGPSYDVALNYLGDVIADKEDLYFSWDKKPDKRNENFSELAKYFDDPKILELFSGMDPAEELAEQLWDQVFGTSKRKSVYACYIELDYQSLTGRMHKGIKPFNVVADPADDSIRKGWRFGVTVTTAGESGLNEKQAKGTYQLPYPNDFEKQFSHWYVKPDQRIIDESAAIMKGNKAIAKDNKSNHSFDALMATTPWMTWQGLSDGGEFWSDKRKDYVNNWLVKQAQRRYLPAGDTVAFSSKEEAAKAME